LRIGHGDRFQASVNHVTDGQQKLFEDKRNVDEQLLFDFDELILVRQLKRHGNRLIGFTELFDDFFHDVDPLTVCAGYTVAQGHHQIHCAF
jgi:hypothetical protein